MKRSILALVGIWVVLVASATVYTYGDITTQNAGVWWPLPPGHHCGFEYRGNPGFFCDVD